MLDRGGGRRGFVSGSEVDADCGCDHETGVVGDVTSRAVERLDVGGTEDRPQRRAKPPSRDTVEEEVNGMVHVEDLLNHTHHCFGVRQRRHKPHNLVKLSNGVVNVAIS